MVSPAPWTLQHHLQKCQLSYPEKSEATALRNFNLTPDDGGGVAIVDILGSGKFAIPSLQRLYEPTSGSVAVVLNDRQAPQILGAWHAEGVDRGEWLWLVVKLSGDTPQRLSVYIISGSTSFLLLYPHSILFDYLEWTVITQIWPYLRHYSIFSSLTLHYYILATV